VLVWLDAVLAHRQNRDAKRIRFTDCALRVSTVEF